MSLARNIGDLPNGDDAPLFGCRAWINFNGESTVAIRGSGNVSSLTDLGTGHYRITFTNAMPDDDYSVVLGQNRYSYSQASKTILNGLQADQDISDTNFEIYVGSVSQGSAGSAVDSASVLAAIFR